MIPESSSSSPGWLAALENLVSSGGPVVVLLIVLSVLALAIAIAKAIQFFLVRVGHNANAREALQLHLSGDEAGAASLLKGDRSLGADLLRHLSGASGNGVEEAVLREDIERVANDRLTGLRSWLRALDMVAQTSPLIGLFGTVLGMIEAFRAMQGAGANVDPSVLAGGIWVALLTTAVGLAIAIPASAVVGWFDSRIDRQQMAAESIVTAFFTRAAAERAAPAGATAYTSGKAGGREKGKLATNAA